MPFPLIPVVIDEATPEDAGEWRAALPYVRFPVSEYRADARCSREGDTSSPALPADLVPPVHASPSSPEAQQDHVR